MAIRRLTCYKPVTFENALLSPTPTGARIGRLPVGLPKVIPHIPAAFRILRRFRFFLCVVASLRLCVEKSLNTWKESHQLSGFSGETNPVGNPFAPTDTAGGLPGSRSAFTRISRVSRSKDFLAEDLGEQLPFDSRRVGATFNSAA
jgi:hypothetical protein